jgi:nitroimidazol reductase NimA-like FMN-containing flavoprotein (pyridoxamine 5'-phosphate oxidase superfamily)
MRVFKEMRRKDRQISAEEAVEILNKCHYGVLSTVGENGYAYGVPLSYVYADGKVYIHCALSGHKLENIEYNNKVSFCVVDGVEALPDKFSTKYESVIVFGRVEGVTGEESYSAHIELLKKYSSDYVEEGKEYFEKAKERTKTFKINIEHITGKKRA